ncbi:MAG: TatD family hydrolase [Zoogloeaceae bacterium]|jgi:TatD DNase family protein|nr:TatD family hydrolase [Zoogloeaceae bacterium]
MPLRCPDLPGDSGGAFLVDSHCHLDFPELSARLPQVLEHMRQSRVAGALCVGVNLEDFPRVLRIAETYPQFFASAGLHPEYAPENEAGEARAEPDETDLARLAALPRVIAIGETGLDYHWHKDQPEWQRQRFRAHIRAARTAGRPLIIHCRDAADDTLAILREEKAETAGGIFHCFSGNREMAKRVLELGFYLSFSGIVTFKNARELKEVAAWSPLDRILVETDAPYLAPVPFRGKANEPAYVRYVAEEVAALRGMTVASLMTESSENFFRLFPETRAALCESARSWSAIPHGYSESAL